MIDRRQVVAAAATLPIAVSAEVPATKPFDALLRERLVQQHAPGFAAVQVDAAGPHFTNAGHTGGDHDVPVSETTLFELGSLTKTFTALLLADAVVRRELALEDPVDAALPGGLKLCDARGDPLRWIDLATQRSGLPRLPNNFAPRDPADPYADYGEAQLLAFLRDWKPVRARGEAYEYSNLGFGLLGYALAHRARQTYAALLTERVLRPLGIDDLYVALPTAAVAHEAAGHDVDGHAVPGWHFSVLAGAGALVGSTRAVGRYAAAALGLFPHSLGPAFALCLQRHADGMGPTHPIGLAWNLVPKNGRTLFNHDGGTFGFSCSLFVDPESGRAAAVLANAMVGVNDLALHALDASLPAADFTSTQQAAVKTSAEELVALQGRYTSTSPPMTLTVTAQADRLFAQANGQQAFELFAQAPRTFFARVTPLRMRFDGEQGESPGLVLEQGGKTLHFEREHPPAALKLTTEQLAPLAGRYALSPQFAVVITLRGGSLFAQATGQPEFELFAESPRVFVAHVTPLRIRFEGDLGGAPAFTLEQGGQNMRFTRTGDR